jgi:nucleoside 2-deoxyribosyltransferase
MPHILRLIVKARVIVAVIDGRNPNVFYELGIAHALNKVTILVSSDVQSAPLDLRSRKLIVADSPETLQAKLVTELARTIVAASVEPS